MAKKQTRRSVSISRAAYERLLARSERENKPMSQIVQDAVDAYMLRPLPHRRTDDRVVDLARELAERDCRPASSVERDRMATVYLHRALSRLD